MSIYEAIAAYLDAWDDMRKAYYEYRLYKWPLEGNYFILHDNPKWLKIVNVQPDVAGIPKNTAEAFIDRETGDIYRAASWNRPAKRVRGNVFSPTHGMEAMDTSIYPGVRYLRL
jgi:hypothetical protein